MLERRSALATVLDPALAVADAPTHDHRLGEIRGHVLIQAAGFRSTVQLLEQKLTDVTGLGIPPRIGLVVRSDTAKILRTGPEQFWIVARGLPDLDARLQAAIPQTVGGIIALTNSRTRIYVEGPHARDILLKGFAIDLAPDRFPVDHFVLTGLDHTPVLLYRSTQDRYEIWTMRTFARTVWDWLTDAALEFGASVVTRPKEGQTP
jgi:heterotetrameric sarcosine oxidase gamma subunit